MALFSAYPINLASIIVYCMMTENDILENVPENILNNIPNN